MRRDLDSPAPATPDRASRRRLLVVLATAPLLAAEAYPAPAAADPALAPPQEGERARGRQSGRSRGRGGEGDEGRGDARSRAREEYERQRQEAAERRRQGGSPPQAPAGGSRSRPTAVAPRGEPASVATDLASPLRGVRARGHAVRGGWLLDEGRHEEAIVELDKAIELDPENSWARRRLAESFEATGRPQEMRREMGWSEYHAGRPDVALSWFGAAVENDPRDAEALVGRGTARLAFDQVADGLADLERALEVAPGFGLAYAVRAEHRLRRGETPAAIADLDRALAADPARATWRARRAEALLRAGEPESARADLQALVREDPANPPYLLVLAQAKLATGDPEGALADLDPLTVERNVYRGAWSARAAVLGRLGRTEEALEAAERAIAEERTPSAYATRAFLRLQAGQTAEGLQDLTLAVRLDPGLAPAAALVFDDSIADDGASFRAYHGRAVAHYQMGRYEEALADLERAREHTSPANGLDAYDEGLALQRLGRHREAIRAFDRALSRGGVYAAAHLARGRSRSALGERDAAMKDYLEVNRNSPLHEEARMHLVQAMREKGERDSALEFSREFLGSRNPEALYIRALLVAESGDVDEGNRLLRKAARLDPRDERFRKSFVPRGSSFDLKRHITFENIGKVIVGAFAVSLVGHAIAGDEARPAAADYGGMSGAYNESTQHALQVWAEALASDNVTNF